MCSTYCHYARVKKTNKERIIIIRFWPFAGHQSVALSDLFVLTGGNGFNVSTDEPGVIDVHVVAVVVQLTSGDP